MKKMLLIGMFSMLATATLGISAADAHRDFYNDRHHGQYQQQNYQLRDDARFVLQRTSGVLQRAQDTVRNQRDRRGPRGRHQQMGPNGLGMAFSFQMRARDLYQQGMYQPAIDCSLRARAIAFQVIDRANRGPDGWRRGEDFRGCDMDRGQLDVREVRYWDQRPDESRLEVNIHGHEVSDNDAVSIRLDLNF